MQKTLLLCVILASLKSCTPSQNPVYRAREDRPYPDPTLGTDNRESQWYKTQILASPSTAGPAGAPAANLPAQLPAKPVPAHRASPAVSPGAQTPAGKSGL
jgi:hypothetical protein